MTISSLVEHEGNCNTNGIKSRLYCLAGSILMVALARLIFDKFNQLLPIFKNTVNVFVNKFDIFFMWLRPAYSEISKYMPYILSVLIVYKFCEWSKNKKISFLDCSLLFFVFSLFISDLFHIYMNISFGAIFGAIFVSNFAFMTFTFLSSYDTQEIEEIEEIEENDISFLSISFGLCIAFLAVIGFWLLSSKSILSSYNY